MNTEQFKGKNHAKENAQFLINRFKLDPTKFGDLAVISCLLKNKVITDLNIAEEIEIIKTKI